MKSSLFWWTSKVAKWSLPLSLWVPLSSNEDNGRSPFNEKPAKMPLLHNQIDREKENARGEQVLFSSFGGDLKKAEQGNRALPNQVQVNGHMGHVTIRMWNLDPVLAMCHSGVKRMMSSLMVKSLFYEKRCPCQRDYFEFDIGTHSAFSKTHSRHFLSMCCCSLATDNSLSVTDNDVDR